MQKYYLHNGTDQQGPFDFEELKARKISKSTPIWYAGLDNWTTAEQIPALQELFIPVAPPPFYMKAAPPTTFQNPASSEPVYTPVPQKQKSYGGIAFSVVVLILLVLGGLYYVNQRTESSPGKIASTEIYQEKVMTVKEIELSQPTRFLTASGTYNDNFWGDKVKVHGTVTNTATAATFKDPVVKITYFSKSNTPIGDKTYTIYEIIPPHSTINFELKVYKYQNTDRVDWEVIKATPN